MRLGNVHISVVSLCYVVDLIILRNRVFRPRNVQICVVLSCKVVVQLNYPILFQAAIRSDMDCDEVQGVYLMIVRMAFSGSNASIRALTF